MEDAGSGTGKEYLSLTPKQRRLLYGEESFERSVQLENIITNKVRRLPKRLDNLLTDIDALSEANFFESDWEPPLSDAMKQNRQDVWESYQWESIHRQILDDDGVAGLISDDAIGELEPSPDGEIRQFNENARSKNLGKSLGIAIHQLTYDCMSHEERNELLVGFFEGLLLGKEGPSNYREGNQTVSSALDAIAEPDWEFKLRAMAADFPDSSEQMRSPKRHENIKLAEIAINRTNLIKSDTLLEYIIDEAFQFPTSHGPSVSSTNFASRPIPKEEDPLPKYKSKSVEKKKLLRGELVAELVERNTEIKKINMLVRYVEVSKYVFKNNENIRDVFKRLYQAHKSETTDIDEKLSNPKRFMSDWGSNQDDWGSNKGIAYTLAGTKGKLKDIELLTTDSEGEWKIDPLGELVGYICIDEDSTYPIDELCHRYVLDKEITNEESQLIQAAIDTFYDINNTNLRDEQLSRD